MRRAFATSMLFCLACAGSTDAPSATPEEQAKRLMHQGLTVARDRLERGQAIWPYAYAERVDGRIARIGAPGTQTEADSLAGVAVPETHTAASALDALTQQLAREQAAHHGYRAVAIFAETEIRLPKKGETSAIQIGLEQVSGYCTDVYYPYGRLIQGELVLGEPVSAARKGAVFAKCR